MNFKKHIACALLAVLMLLPMGQGILPLNATASDGMYGQIFSETLDFDDLKVGDRLSASYVNDALVWDFSSFADGSGQSSPTRWKIYDDPKNAGNNVIGLVNQSSFGLFSIKDDDMLLYETPFELSFRFCLNAETAITTLLGWYCQSDKRMALLRLSGNKLGYRNESGADVWTDDKGNSHVFEYGQWYDLRTMVFPETGRVIVHLDGQKVFDYIHAEIKGMKPSMSGIHICYGWSNVRLDAFLDDICIRSVEGDMFAELEKQEAKKDEMIQDEYVIDAIKQYRKSFQYVENDGKIGIPVAVTCYYKGEESTANTPVVVCPMNYVGAGEVGREDPEVVLADLLDEGYIVVTADYLDDSGATGTALDWSVQAIRMAIRNYLGGLSYLSHEVYVVPEGYRLARNIVYYNIDQQARRGTIEKIIRDYNDPNGSFRKAKLAKIPNPDEKVTTIERCLKPDGTPIDLQLKLDIIYPSGSEEPAPVVMISSSSETRMKVCATNAQRPLDVGPLLRGCAVAVYDHAYVPMARDDHYGYFGSYSLMWTGTINSHASAVRCVRYYADMFGYSRDKYAVMGHSKASQCGVLACEHPESIKNWSDLPEGYASDECYGEQLFLAWDDGTPIPSGVSVAYHSMGDGSKNHKTFLDSKNAPTMICCGVEDQYGSWDYWYQEVANYEASGIDYVPIAMSDLGHAYPIGIDPEYKYDRFGAFMDFLMYYLKEDIAPRVLYSSVVDGKLVGEVTITRYDKEGSKNFSHATVQGNGQLFVQFVAPVTAESAKAGISLWDETAKQEVAGSLISAGNGNRWYFNPANSLVTGHSYTLRVDSSVKSVLNGMCIGDSVEFSFVA